jgi:2-epi-5-epi-valiolone synthase
VKHSSGQLAGVPRYVAFVELEKPSCFSVTLVEKATLLVVGRRDLTCAPVGETLAATAEGLADVVMREFPAVSYIVLLRDDMPGHATFEPEVANDGSVPVFVLSRSIALVHAVPGTSRRFVLVDFKGAGAFWLVKRADTIEELTCYASSLAAACGMLPLAGTDSGDMLRMVASPREIAKEFGALLRVAHGFDYTASVLVSAEFVDNELARTVTRCVNAECGGQHSSLALSAEDALYRGAVAAISSRGRAHGIVKSAASGSTVMSMRVAREISYDVTQLVEPVFDARTLALSALVQRRPVLFGIDEAVDVLYGESLRSYAGQHLNAVSIVTLKGSESYKNLGQVESVCDAAISAGLPRNGVMIGVGGGVVLDIVGMAAALYRRGVSFVRIPTTLLGMIDVAVGIKQAVNFGNKKNVLGTFYPPLAVLNDATFLRTVSRRDLVCGVAEMIKIGLIADRDLFCLLERHLEGLLDTSFQAPSAISREILVRSQVAMMAELAPNLYEDNLKRAVDFGHSFSPTLELRSNFSLRHGEAVAIDMLLATAIAVHRGICPASLFDRLIAMYNVADLMIPNDLCTPELLMEALVDTKTHRGGHLNFPVPSGVGNCAFLQRVSASDLRAALNAIVRAGDSSLLAATS